MLEYVKSYAAELALVDAVIPQINPLSLFIESVKSLNKSTPDSFCELLSRIQSDQNSTDFSKFEDKSIKLALTKLPILDLKF